MGSRILPSSSLLGTQSLVVDAQGNGDYSTIQAALNAAAVYASASSRWSVRVAPGVYTEQITLKDYVDLAGLAPGKATHLKRATGNLFAAPATCTVSNLWLETVDSPVVVIGSGFTGTLDLDNVTIDQTALDVSPITLAGGVIRIFRSLVASGGPISISGGSLEAHYSDIWNQAASDGGSNMVLYMQHGFLLINYCLLQNISPAGYCMVIDGMTAALRAYYSTFRKKDSTNAIEVIGTSTRDMTLAHCCGNGPLSGYLGGYHDYVYDATL